MFTFLYQLKKGKYCFIILTAVLKSMYESKTKTKSMYEIQNNFFFFWMKQMLVISDYCVSCQTKNYSSGKSIDTYIILNEMALQVKYSK